MNELPTSAEVGIVPVGALGVAFFHHLGGGKPANLGKVGFIEPVARSTVPPLAGTAF
jgi:hypothetical protein